VTYFPSGEIADAIALPLFVNCVISKSRSGALSVDEGGDDVRPVIATYRAPATISISRRAPAPSTRGCFLASATATWASDDEEL
jgi:hypothetical protein